MAGPYFSEFKVSPDENVSHDTGSFLRDYLENKINREYKAQTDPTPDSPNLNPPAPNPQTPNPSTSNPPPTIDLNIDPPLDLTLDTTFDLTPTVDPPTLNPTVDLTLDFAIDPTLDLTPLYPTFYPTFDPTFDHTLDLIIDAALNLTLDPTSDPTPTLIPTPNPTPNPTLDPTIVPTLDPTQVNIISNIQINPPRRPGSGQTGYTGITPEMDSFLRDSVIRYADNQEAATQVFVNPTPEVSDSEILGATQSGALDDIVSANSPPTSEASVESSDSDILDETHQNYYGKKIVTVAQVRAENDPVASANPEFQSPQSRQIPSNPGKSRSVLPEPEIVVAGPCTNRKRKFSSAFPIGGESTSRGSEVRKDETGPAKRPALDPSPTSNPSDNTGRLPRRRRGRVLNVVLKYAKNLLCPFLFCFPTPPSD